MSRRPPKAAPATPQELVRQWMKAGKVKKKCCRSKDRCKKCPIRALKKARRKIEKSVA